MKVLHLIPSLGSGGAERQLSLVAPELQARGVDVHIAHGAGGHHHRRLADSAVSMHRFRIANNHDPRLLWQIVSLIRKMNPDIVQTWLLQMDVFGGLAAKLTGRPFILSERSSKNAYPDDWKNRTRISIGRRADAIIANSAGGVAYWRELRARGPLHLIRNCLAPDPAPIAQDLSDSRKELVLFAGRFSTDKNVQVLLEAFIEVAKARRGVVFKMFGEGPLHGALMRRLHETGLSERIEIHGFTDQIGSWMRASRMCVSVSGFEGHPNVVLEAASQGCPLVLSDIPAHREVLSDDAALFVPTNSANVIAAGIARVLDEPALASHRAQKALEAVQCLTVDATVTRYIDVYTRMLHLGKA
jgi:glycosyltransferase involved in cell wall biosynthesis